MKITISFNGVPMTVQTGDAIPPVAVQYGSVSTFISADPLIDAVLVRWLGRVWLTTPAGQYFSVDGSALEVRILSNNAKTVDAFTFAFKTLSSVQAPKDFRTAFGAGLVKIAWTITEPNGWTTIERADSEAGPWKELITLGAGNKYYEDRTGDQVKRFYRLVHVSVGIRSESTKVLAGIGGAVATPVQATAIKGLVGIESMPEPLRGQTIADCSVKAASFWYTPTWFSTDAEAAANRPNCDWSTGFLKQYPQMQAVLRFGREPMQIPADDAALARYVRPVLDDHRAYIDRIILGGGNEPQYPKFFVGTVQQYVDRVQRPLYKLAKAHDARWRVAGPAVVFDGSSNDALVMKQFTDAGLFDCIDVFDVHPYATSAGVKASLRLIPAGLRCVSSEWNGPIYGTRTPEDVTATWELLQARCDGPVCLYAADNQVFDKQWKKHEPWYTNYRNMK